MFGVLRTSLIYGGLITQPTGHEGSAASFPGHSEKLLVHAHTNQSCAGGAMAEIFVSFNVVVGENDKVVFSEMFLL